MTIEEQLDRVNAELAEATSGLDIVRLRARRGVLEERLVGGLGRGLERLGGGMRRWDEGKHRRNRGKFARTAPGEAAHGFFGDKSGTHEGVVGNYFLQNNGTVMGAEHKIITGSLRKIGAHDLADEMDKMRATSGTSHAYNYDDAFAKKVLKKTGAKLQPSIYARRA